MNFTRTRERLLAYQSGSDAYRKKLLADISDLQKKIDQIQAQIFEHDAIDAEDRAILAMIDKAEEKR